MPLGLFPRESQDILAGGMDQGTTPPPQPGFFQGALSTIIPGIEEGAAKTLFAMQPDHPAVIGMNLPESAYTLPEPISPDEYKQKLAADTTAAIKTFAPDPHTIGVAGQTLHGLASGLTRILAGSALAGPVGGAVAVGGSEGVATTRQLQSQGVDPDTAAALGAGTALFSGAGAMLPGGVGRTLLERVTSGAYGQFALGMVNRGLMHNVLDEAGYPQMAKAYQPLDGAAMLSDVVLGIGFGAVHHAFSPLPSDIDAAHAVKEAEQVERAGGGPAADAPSRTAIIDNQTGAAEALIRGDGQPPDTADVRMVPNPAQEAAREASAKATEEAGAEVAGKPVEVPEKSFEELNAELDKIREQVKAAKEQSASGLSRADRMAKQEAETAAALDPATAESVAQAQAILDRRGELQIENEDGQKVSAAEALRNSVEDVKTAQGDEEIHRVAAACFGRV